MADRRPLRATVIAIVAAVVLAACSGSGSGSTPLAPTALPPSAAPASASPDAPVASASPATTLEPAASGPGSESPTPAASAVPTIDAAWAQADLVDVATGETFRIQDLAGKTVIIETMAIWCVNCRAQQGDVYEALGQLDPDRVEYVLLDVDPNETGPALAEYRTDNGFTGTYAVAGRDVARALAADFGDQVLNPPSTPMILIGTDGRVTLADFGHKNPDTVIQLARDHGG